MEEGTSETEHKGWCDTELATNKVTRDAKSEEVSKLKADIENLNAEIAQVTQDLSHEVRLGRFQSAVPSSLQHCIQ